MTIPDLEAAVLAAVLQLSPDAYGVAIRRRLDEMLGRAPSTGAMHQALSRLEQDGLLTARVGEPTAVRGGRAKRLFTLTASGARELRRAQREAEDRAKTLTQSWRPA